MGGKIAESICRTQPPPALGQQQARGDGVGFRILHQLTDNGLGLKM